jgi:DNA topoisomerase-1
MPAVRTDGSKLCHTADDIPGIRRVACRSGFRYVGPSGREVTDAKTLARIRALVVPPAWTDVWICPQPHGHLQATGRDSRGRKQYRYHTAYRADRDGTKFESLAAFADALPRLRRRIARDLRRPGLPREKVLAAVVRLLDRTHLRVGNEEYVRANQSYGLSTLRDRHATFHGDRLTLRFRGKSGVWHDRTVSDRALTKLVRRCRDLPGQELFQYVDATGKPRPVGSADINAYIRQAAGGEFTAKVFRTWAGSAKAAVLLASAPADTPTARAREVVAVVRVVAADLGNTPAVCRKSYIHPTILSAYLDGSLRLPDVRSVPYLSAAETALRKMLKGK